MVHSKPTTIFLTILNNLPIVLGFLGGWFPALEISSCVSAVSFVALVVDFWKCKVRWNAGKLAEWPKLIAVTFFVVNGIILVLLIKKIMTDSDFKKWSGVITVTSLLLMSVLSSICKRPWTWAESIEYLEHWKDPEAAERILSDPEHRQNFWLLNVKLTNLWSVAFFVTLLMQCVGVYIDKTNHAVAVGFFVGGPVVVSYVTLKKGVPWAVEKHRAELRTAADSSSIALVACDQP